MRRFWNLCDIGKCGVFLLSVTLLTSIGCADSVSDKAADEEPEVLVEGSKVSLTEPQGLAAGPSIEHGKAAWAFAQSPSLVEGGAPIHDGIRLLNHIERSAAFVDVVINLMDLDAGAAAGAVLPPCMVAKLASNTQSGSVDLVDCLVGDGQLSGTGALLWDAQGTTFYADLSVVADGLTSDFAMTMDWTTEGVKVSVTDVAANAVANDGTEKTIAVDTLKVELDAQPSGASMTSVPDDGLHLSWPDGRTMDLSFEITSVGIAFFQGAVSGVYQEGESTTELTDGNLAGNEFETAVNITVKAQKGDMVLDVQNLNLTFSSEGDYDGSIEGKFAGPSVTVTTKDSFTFIGTSQELTLDGPVVVTALAVEAYGHATNVHVDRDADYPDSGEVHLTWSTPPIQGWRIVVTETTTFAAHTSDDGQAAVYRREDTVEPNGKITKTAEHYFCRNLATGDDTPVAKEDSCQAALN